MTGNSSQPAAAVVVAIDRLGAGFLGPYGNTWLDTPQFSRLAGQALVCETVLADSPELALAYRAWWTGRHALEPALDQACPALPAQASAAGLRSVLVTDEPLVAELPDAGGFDERILVPQQPAAAAAEIEETALGRLFLTAIERTSTIEEPALVWIHSRGMAGPWDAPYALRERLADEDDPPPPDFVDPPQTHLPSDADPDLVLGYVQAYGGQVALADACLGMLMAALEGSLAERALLAVTSPRGYPLGEHRSVGGNHDLFSELLQVPLLVRPPAGSGSPLRLQHLVQPADLYATLAAWLGLPALPPGSFAQNLLPSLSGEALPPRQLLHACGSGRWAARTPAWHLMSAVVDDDVYRQLYAKPDDRWEANEVASRCGEIVEQLAVADRRFSEAAAAGKAADLPPLESALVDTRR